MKILWPALAGAALLLGACASTPPAPSAEQHAEVAGAALDLGVKFRMPNRERGRRDKAAMNAQYQLATEASESGPPTSAQIFLAHEQRRAIERDTLASARAKAAGLQP